MKRSIHMLAVAALALTALPLLLVAAGQEFYLGLLTRVLIYALAATSLNLLLGYGGMVSFGHAAFFGIGGYGVAILASHGVGSAWITWPVALVILAAVAVIIGAVSLRTQGVQFLMITLALAQMCYYFFVSLRGYGGDDGMPLSKRSTFGWESWWATHGDLGYYYLVLILLALVLIVARKLVQSSFGRVLMGVRDNETRMDTIGFSVFRYKLVAFVMAATLCGLAGILNVELNRFISPSTMHWSQSGMLMVMVIIGGPGRPWAGCIGATVFLGLEEILSHITEHWQLPMGLMLLALVLVRAGGLGWSSAAHRKLRHA